MPNIMDENGNVVDLSNNNVASTNNGKINAQGIASALGGAASAFGTAYSTYADVQSPDYWVQRANAFQVGPNYGGSSLDNWEQAFLNYKPLSHLKLSDVGYNTGKGIMNALGAGVQGAGAGASIGGGWGALAGGIIGTIGGLFGMGAAKRKANRTVDIGNKAIDYTNDFNMASLHNSLGNVTKNMNINAVRNAAFGGPLNMSGDGVLSPFGSRFSVGGPMHSYGADWTNGIKIIGEGGTHEENPYEGVQMGIDPQGVPNLVEEGEVVTANDYVVSNRLIMPNKDRVKYKLTGPKNLTYAEIYKREIKKMGADERLDPITQNGVAWLDSIIEESQEKERQKEQMKELKKQAKELGMTPEELLYAMQQQQQQPMTAAYGGSIHIKPSKRGTFTAAAKKHGKSVQEFASQVLANKDNYSSAMVKKANFAKNAAGWKHGLGGNLFLYGSDMIIGPEPYKDQPPYLLDNNYNYGWFNNNSYTFPQMYNYWDEFPKDKTVWTPSYGLVTANDFKTKSAADAEIVGTDAYNRTNSKSPAQNSNSYDWTTGLRYAPILSSAISGIRNLLTPADYSRANDVERAYIRGIKDIKVTPKYNYMQYRPIDRMMMANMIGQQAAATRRNIMNTSGGNRGTAIAGLLASDNQYLNKLGEAFIAGDAENYKRYAQTLDTNNKINQWLGQLDLGVQEANQRAAEARARGVQLSRSMMDATDAQRAAAINNDWTNVAQGLGDIGWEQFNRNMVNTSNPLYSIDSSGHAFYDPQKMIKALGDSDGRRWMVLKTKNDAGETTKAEEEELAELYRKANTAVGGAYYGNVPVKRGKRAKGGYLTIKGRRK